jgi:hypothetical protein
MMFWLADDGAVAAGRIWLELAVILQALAGRGGPFAGTGEG